MTDTSTRTVSDIVAELEMQHEKFLTELYPNALSLLEAAAKTYGDDRPAVREAFALFRDMRPLLERHFAEEESDVFPACEKLAGGDTSAAPDVKRHLHSMEDDHDEIGLGVRRVHELLDGYATPDGAGDDYADMAAAMELLEEVLHRHTYTENFTLVKATFGA